VGGVNVCVEIPYFENRCLALKSRMNKNLGRGGAPGSSPAGKETPLCFLVYNFDNQNCQKIYTNYKLQMTSYNFINKFWFEEIRRRTKMGDIVMGVHNWGGCVYK